MTKLLRSGQIIRIKKGLYIRGETFRNGQVPAQVANLIYGPSYISKMSALHLHGLIETWPSAVQSVTFTKHKKFRTPIGEFHYDLIPANLFTLGVTCLTHRGQAVWVARPEKALADLVATIPSDHEDEICHFVTNTIGLGRETLATLNVTLLHKLQRAYQSPSVDILANLCRDLQCAA